MQETRGSYQVFCACIHVGHLRHASMQISLQLLIKIKRSRSKTVLSLLLILRTDLKEQSVTGIFLHITAVPPNTQFSGRHSNGP